MSENFNGVDEEGEGLSRLPKFKMVCPPKSFRNMWIDVNNNSADCMVLSPPAHSSKINERGHAHRHV